MKKIVAIAPYTYLPFFSGGQKLLAQFFEYLGKETNLTVIGTVDNAATTNASYTLQPILKKSFYRYLDLGLIKKVITIVRQQQADAVIWEHPYFAWLAWLVKKRTGVLTIIHTHNIEYQRFQSTGRWWWPILQRYEKWCFTIADTIFFITPEDKQFAITNWKIPAEKCKVVPFGVTINQHPVDKEKSQQLIRAKHQLPAHQKIILFNGLLDYKPNLDALKVILEKINPLLLATTDFDYSILICGKRLPADMNELKAYADQHIIYAGFVDDIELYFKAADIFLNPVQSGGGIKTKMVEAIAYGATVIATTSGAAGIDPAVCGNKVQLITDNDWSAFAAAILATDTIQNETPDEYYQTFYWGNIVKKIVEELH